MRGVDIVGNMEIDVMEKEQSEETKRRMKRIRVILSELEYEVTRGMMEGEIDEHMGFRFCVPVSKQISDGVVQCEFRTRPMPRYAMTIEDCEPRLRVVE